jgi:hypothetical protein
MNLIIPELRNIKGRDLSSERYQREQNGIFLNLAISKRKDGNYCKISHQYGKTNLALPKLDNREAKNGFCSNLDNIEVKGMLLF